MAGLLTLYVCVVKKAADEWMIPLVSRTREYARLE